MKRLALALLDPRLLFVVLWAAWSALAFGCAEPPPCAEPPRPRPVSDVFVQPPLWVVAPGTFEVRP